MVTIDNIKNIILNHFQGQNQKFFYTHNQISKINNPDESHMGFINLQFTEFPDENSEADIYIQESGAFEKYLIKELKSLGIEFQNLNNNGHYFCNDEYGDTIAVHFNDKSLMVIITMTGQY